MEPVVGGLHEVEGSQNSLEYDDLARFAVDQHNKKNANVEFQKVVNVKTQVVVGIKYYITLEGTDGGQKKVYEAIVWVKPWMMFKKLKKFKRIGDAYCSEFA